MLGLKTRHKKKPLLPTVVRMWRVCGPKQGMGITLSPWVCTRAGSVLSPRLASPFWEPRSLFIHESSI